MNEYKQQVKTVKTDITETAQVAAEQDVEQKAFEENGRKTISTLWPSIES